MRVPPRHPERGGLAPMPRERLADRVACRLGEMIGAGAFAAGRLPPIGEMARGFAVARQTVREALAILEWLGVVEIRPGAGVYLVGGAGAAPRVDTGIRPKPTYIAVHDHLSGR